MNIDSEVLLLAFEPEVREVIREKLKDDNQADLLGKWPMMLTIHKRVLNLQASFLNMKLQRYYLNLIL